MNKVIEATVSKTPEITLFFWVLKILATTLGETGGDAVSMSLNLGYLVSSGLFFVVFLATVFAQARSKSFRPSLYWLTIIATTTLGTTVADFADRSLGIGYAGARACWPPRSQSHCWFGAGSRARLMSTTYRPREERASTGRRSCSPKRWARRSATGWRIPMALALEAALSYSPARWRSSRSPITLLPCRGSRCSGPPLCSPVPSARRSAISLTSPSRSADSRSTDLAPRRRC